MLTPITITKEQFFDAIKNKNDTEDKITKFTQHYLDYYDLHQATGKKINLNWIAGFFPGFCFLYRKMYLHAILFNFMHVHWVPLGVLWFGLTLFLQQLLPQPDVFRITIIGSGLLLFFMSRFVFSCIFDYLYLRHINAYLNKTALRPFSVLNFFLLSVLILFFVVLISIPSVAEELQKKQKQIQSR